MSTLLDRKALLEEITLRLSIMQTCIKWQASRGLNDHAKIAEDVMAAFLNALCGWQLINLNQSQANYPAADLGDSRDEVRVAVQITVQNSVRKVSETHEKAREHNLAKDFDRLIILFLLDKAPGDPPSRDFIPCEAPKIEKWAMSDLGAKLLALDLDRLRVVLDALRVEMSSPVFQEAFPQLHENEPAVLSRRQPQEGTRPFMPEDLIKVETPRIFISAVFREFRSVCTRIEEAIKLRGYEPVVVDVPQTEHTDFRNYLMETLASCHGFIQIIGDAYGSEPPTHDAEFERCSYVQFEFFQAKKLGLMMMLLVAGPHFYRDNSPDIIDFHGEAHLIQSELPAAKRLLEKRATLKQLQRKFRSSAPVNNRNPRPLTNDSELEVILATELDDFLLEVWRQHEKKGVPLPAKPPRASAASTQDMTAAPLAALGTAQGDPLAGPSTTSGDSPSKIDATGRVRPVASADQATAEQHMGPRRDQWLQGVADFLSVSPAPLTISIEGPWGRGNPPP